MVLALDGDSTMMRSWATGPPPGPAGARRGRLAPSEAVFLRPVAGWAPATGDCFLRGGTEAISWLRLCCSGDSLQSPFWVEPATHPLIHSPSGCQARQGPAGVGRSP